MKITTAVEGSAHGIPAERHAPDGKRDQTILEKFLTISEAAQAIGVEVWKLRRAAKQGVFPSYTLLNTRRYVKLSEVIAAIEASSPEGRVHD